LHMKRVITVLIVNYCWDKSVRFESKKDDFALVSYSIPLKINKKYDIPYFWRKID